MILYDTPRPTTFRRFRRTSHLVSDQLGAAGQMELIAFGRKIGLQPHWLQKAGQPGEHFDLFDGSIERARLAGAVEVSGRELVERVVRPKRAAWGLELQRVYAAARAAGLEWDGGLELLAPGPVLASATTEQVRSFVAELQRQRGEAA